MMSLKAVSMQNLTIINHNGNYYRVNFAFISKNAELLVELILVIYILVLMVNGTVIVGKSLIF